MAATLAHVRRQAEGGIQRLKREQAALRCQHRDDEAELRRLVCSPGSNGQRAERLADVQERLRLAEQRLTEIDEELVTLSSELVDEWEVARALAEFDQMWSVLAPREQARILGAVCVVNFLARGVS